MNRKERKERWQQHLKREQRLERKYTRKLELLIREQVREFKIDVVKRGLRAATANLQRHVYDPKVSKLLEIMYRDAVFVFGKAEYRSITSMARRVIKKESAAFGHNEEWNYAVTDFLANHLLERAVVPVTSTTRKNIMDVLDQGQENGWSVDRILQELSKVDELAAARARRIIRTELGIANNFAQNLAASSVEFETNEEWITARDHRVRSSHRAMDGVIIHTGELFQVPVIKKKVEIGTDHMTGPGDPTASAGNVINCRCTRAVIPRRDENDELIMKPKQLHNIKI